MGDGRARPSPGRNILVIRRRTFYLDFVPALDAELVRSRSLIECEFDESGAPFDGEKLAALRFREALAEARDRQTGNADREIVGEIPAPEIRDDVSELVDAEDSPEGLVALRPGLRQRPLKEIQDARTDGLDRSALPDVRRD